MSSSSNTSFAPLLENLRRVQSWLELSGAPIMVARRTLREFKRQELPPQCRVSARKMVGPRVAARGRLPEGRMRLVLAHWPEDGMIEGAFPALIFVTNGQADIRMANYIVHCQPGAMLFVPGGIPKLDGSRPHYEKVTPEAYCDLFQLSPGLANGEGLECGFCRSRGGQHISSIKGNSGWLKNHLIAQLFASFASEMHHEGSTKSTFHLLSCILHLLHREFERGNGFSSWKFPMESTAEPGHDPIEQAIAYIKDNLNTPLAIDSVAHQIGFSRRAFTARFREKTGQSFKAYLTQQRLEHAIVLLRDANLSVNKVSDLVGLSPGQLRLLFHQRYQGTPREFREYKKIPEIDAKPLY